MYCRRTYSHHFKRTEWAAIAFLAGRQPQGPSMDLKSNIEPLTDKGQKEFKYEILLGS